MEVKVTCVGDPSDKWEGGRMARMVSIPTQNVLMWKVSKYLTHFERTREVWGKAHYLEEPHFLLQRTCVQFPATTSGAIHPSHSNSRDPGPSSFYKDICFYCVYECFLIHTNVQHECPVPRRAIEASGPPGTGDICSIHVGAGNRIWIPCKSSQGTQQWTMFTVFPHPIPSFCFLRNLHSHTHSHIQTCIIKSK